MTNKIEKLIKEIEVLTAQSFNDNVYLSKLK